MSDEVHSDRPDERQDTGGGAEVQEEQAPPPAEAVDAQPSTLPSTEPSTEPGPPGADTAEATDPADMSEAAPPPVEAMDSPAHAPPAGEAMDSAASHDDTSTSRDAEQQSAKANAREQYAEALADIGQTAVEQAVAPGVVPDLPTEAMVDGDGEKRPHPAHKTTDAPADYITRTR